MAGRRPVNSFIPEFNRCGGRLAVPAVNMDLRHIHVLADPIQAAELVLQHRRQIDAGQSRRRIPFLYCHVAAEVARNLAAVLNAPPASSSRARPRTAPVQAFVSFAEDEPAVTVVEI